MASSLMFLALTMIAASIYQMMRGLIVFVAAILSIIFLRRRFHRHHWTSLFLVVGGVAIVGACPLIWPGNKDDGGSSSSAAIGIILVIIAQFFAGGLMISEEKLLGNYYLHPLKVVGWEGFWGCLIYLILLTIFQFIKCGNADICPHGRLEDTPRAFREMGNNPWILAFGLGSILSIAFFNAFGVAVTKYASAAQRSTIDTSRTLLIWIIFLFKPGKGRETFYALELGGFIMLVLGTLIFNEVVVIPLLGFNKNTKKAKEARKALMGDDGNGEDDEEPTGYMATSPAQYDYQRNSLTKKTDLINGRRSSEKEGLLGNTSSGD